MTVKFTAEKILDALHAVQRPADVTELQLITGSAKSTLLKQLSRLVSDRKVKLHRVHMKPSMWEAIGPPPQKVEPIKVVVKKPELVPPRRIDTRGTQYVPPVWSHVYARPASTDHERCGSLQPDGTVKHRQKPFHGCVGALKDPKSNARD